MTSTQRQLQTHIISNDVKRKQDGLQEHRKEATGPNTTSTSNKQQVTRR